jgi:hypothetical protein
MGIAQNADCWDRIYFFGLAELYYETSCIRCNLSYVYSAYLQCVLCL